MQRAYIAILVFLIAACSTGDKKGQDNKQVVTRAASDIHSSRYEDLNGLISIEDMGNELKVTANVTGLKPNSKFGMHIHEKGICEGPDYKSAGGHFNPHNKPHAGPAGLERHLGDLGNLESDSNGVAKKEIFILKVTPGDLNSVAGKSILVHAKADDFKTQPSGDSGDRIACGLIKPIE